MNLLSDITVLDLGFMVAGPGAARLLADLGALVIKVEPPAGDVARWLTPQGGVSPVFEDFNRGKKSICIDLWREEGQEIWAKLVKNADLVITNFRPAFLERVGITWDSVHRLNRTAVLTIVSTFGADDPDSNIPGGDVVAQAESGIASFNGEPEGTPILAQNSPADVASSLYAALASLASVNEARRTGSGSMVDVSITDAYATVDVGIMSTVLATHGAFEPSRTGRFHNTFTPHGVFRGPGGYAVISAYGAGPNSIWPRLAAALGRPDLAIADGYRSDLDRREHRSEIVAIIEAWLKSFDTIEEAVSVLRAEGVVAGVVRSPHEALTSERARRRGLAQRIAHPVSGSRDVLGSPMRVLGQDASVTAAPSLGSHTTDLLRDHLGYDMEQIELLLRGGVIA